MSATVIPLEPGACVQHLKRRSALTEGKTSIAYDSEGRCNSAAQNLLAVKQQAGD